MYNLATLRLIVTLYETGPWPKCEGVGQYDVSLKPCLLIDGVSEEVTWLCDQSAPPQRSIARWDWPDFYRASARQPIGDELLRRHSLGGSVVLPNTFETHHGICQCYYGILTCQANVNRIEMVQRRYARFVFQDYQRTSSVTDMLNKLGWPILHERRAQAKVYMIYSIKNSLIDIPPSILPPHSNTRRCHSQMLYVPYARTLTYQRSFMPDATRLWNSLPDEFIKCTSLFISRTRCNESSSL